MTHDPHPGNDAGMAMLVRALETRPEINVPPDFAKRVLRSLPRQRNRRRSVRGARALTPRFGIAAAVCAAVMAIALLSATPRHVTTPFIQTGTQLLLSLELLCGALWFGVVRWRSR